MGKKIGIRYDCISVYSSDKETLKKMKIYFQDDVIKRMVVRWRENLISISDNINLLYFYMGVFVFVIYML